MLSVAPRVGALLATLSTTLVVTLAALVLVPPSATASTWLVPAPDASVDPLTHPDEFENRVVDRINAIRRQRGLRPVVRFDSCVDSLSEGWAGYLASSGELRHRDQRRVLSRCGMAWAGEALVRGSGLTPAGVVRAWMASPTHRAILVKARADRAGMAVRTDARGRLVGVLNFTDAP